MVMMIGRWSDAKRVLVCHEVREARFEDIVVMSGEVGCWAGLEGTLVGVSVLSMT